MFAVLTRPSEMSRARAQLFGEEKSLAEPAEPGTDIDDGRLVEASPVGHKEHEPEHRLYTVAQWQAKRVDLNR